MDNQKPLLHPLFSQDAVLQRDRALNIWGWTKPNADVTVKFLHAPRTLRADKDGYWSCSLQPRPAGGPYALEVSSEGQTETRTNLMFGDVWLCSGQSNMEWSVDVADNAAAEKAAANNPNIRLLHVPQNIQAAPVDTVDAKWQVCTPRTVGGFSAVGYFFGRKLNQNLDVPIGLINSSWGGTPAESWVSKGALQTMPTMQMPLEALQQADINQNSPTTLFNGMIHPLLPGQIKGAIWYQGESNADRAQEYRALLPTLILDWRERFGAATGAPMPFYIVQLANFQQPTDDPDNGGWASLREAQSHAAEFVPDTGIVVTTDIGEADDIHPTNKQDVGLRLALAALAQTYGENIEYSGPRLRSVEAQGGALQLSFDHADAMTLKGDANRVFAVADADKKWSWATTTINGNIISLHSDAVAAPVYARFGWSDNPRANLVNSAGLPASPFRTDQ